MQSKKLFVVGLSRTGTTSLHLALVLLGYASIHYPAVSARRWMQGSFTNKMLEEYDSVSDIPVSLYFRELDGTFPGSKFILTTREEQAWLASTKAWWDKTPKSSQNTVLRDMVRMGVYGTTKFSASRFLDKYRAHVTDVREYFSCRPESLLELDVADDNKWEKICSFLGVSQPNATYPHAISPRLGKFKAVSRQEINSKKTELEAFFMKI